MLRLRPRTQLPFVLEHLEPKHESRLEVPNVTARQHKFSVQLSDSIYRERKGLGTYMVDLVLQIPVWLLITSLTPDLPPPRFLFETACIEAGWPADLVAESQVRILLVGLPFPLVSYAELMGLRESSSGNSNVIKEGKRGSMMALNWQEDGLVCKSKWSKICQLLCCLNLDAAILFMDS